MILIILPSSSAKVERMFSQVTRSLTAIRLTIITDLRIKVLFLITVTPFIKT